MNHRIAMLTTLHPHDDIRIYHKESKALARAGWRVEIYNPRMEAAGEYGIRFRRLILPSTRMIRLLRGRSIAYRALFESRADLFMLHDPELLPHLYWRKVTGSFGNTWFCCHNYSILFSLECKFTANY